MSETQTPTKRVLSYKGFEAGYTWSNVAQCWIGFLLHLESDIFFRFNREDEAELALKDTVDRLLDDCCAIMQYFAGLNAKEDTGRTLH